MFIAPKGKAASVSYSTTMDIVIIREVFFELVPIDEVNLQICNGRSSLLSIIIHSHFNLYIKMF